MSFTSFATIASVPLAIQGIRSLESVGEHLLDSVGEGASFLSNLVAPSTSTASDAAASRESGYVADQVAAVVDKLKSLFREEGIEGPFELTARTGSDAEVSVEFAGVDAESVERALVHQPQLLDEVGKMVKSLSAATGGTFQAVFRMTEQNAEVSYSG